MNGKTVKLFSSGRVRTVKVVEKNCYPCEESREEEMPGEVGRETLFEYR